jgi:hypothetical protein
VFWISSAEMDCWVRLPVLQASNLIICHTNSSIGDEVTAIFITIGHKGQASNHRKWRRAGHYGSYRLHRRGLTFDIWNATLELQQRLVGNQKLAVTSRRRVGPRHMQLGPIQNLYILVVFVSPILALSVSNLARTSDFLSDPLHTRT